MDNREVYDVAIVGYGPVGASLEDAATDVAQIPGLLHALRDVLQSVGGLAPASHMAIECRGAAPDV